MNPKQKITPSRKLFNKMYSCFDDSNLNLATPWNVSWQICAECNLRCKHCFFEGNESLYNHLLDLPTEKIFSMIDELANDFSIVNLTITGGEPFLRKDIFEILEKIKSKNIVLYIQTNATLINEKMAERLSKILNNNLDCIQVSLDGACEEYYSKIRGKGWFNRSINGIKNLRKYSIPVTVNTTILSTNLDNLLDIYKLCTTLDIQKFSLTRFVPVNKSQLYLIPEAQKLFKTLASIIDYEQEHISNVRLDLHAIKFFDLVATQDLRNIVDIYLKENSVKYPVLCENVSCHIHNILYINCDGLVSFCFRANDKAMALGDAKQESLFDIWERRDKNLFFQPRLKSNMLCAKCKYFSFCKGGCMVSAYLEYNNFEYPDGMCYYAKEQFNI